MDQLTPLQRKELAGDLSNQLARSMRKSEIHEIAQPRDPMTLLGIEQHILDLVAFRQDCIERIAALGMESNEDAVEERAEIQAELDAANLELRKLAGAEVAKVDQCANLLRMCDRMTLHCKDERDRMSRKAKRWEAIKESVENIVMEALIVAERTSFDSPTNRLRVQRNSSPKVEILDATAVQDRFVKVTIEVTADRWKQMKQALPELSEFCVEKERSFITGTISKVLKKAAAEEEAAKSMLEGPLQQKAMKEIERVKGAQLVYGKHLRVE